MRPNEAVDLTDTAAAHTVDQREVLICRVGDASGERAIEACFMAHVQGTSNEARKMRAWLSEHREDRRKPSDKVRGLHRVEG